MKAQNRILFVGLASLDIVSICNGYPIEDTDQRALAQYWARGGNASNNCTVMSKMFEWHQEVNYQVEYFGTIANDYGSRFMVDDFHKHKVKIENVVFHDEMTSPLSIVTVNDKNGSRTIVHFNKDLPELSFEEFKKLNLENYCFIHFEGRNTEEVKKMINYVREIDTKREIRISVELEKSRPELKDLLYLDADFFFVEKDFALMMECCNINEVMDKISLLVPSSSTIICPWGENGAKAINNTTKKIVSSPIFPPKNGVIDTLGAGDTFLASTVFALQVLQLDVGEAIQFGCRVAGAKCGIRGYQQLSQFEMALK